MEKTKQNFRNRLIQGFTILFALASVFTACDTVTKPAEGPSKPTERTLTITGIESTYNGGTMSVQAFINKEIVAFAYPLGQIANGEGTVTLSTFGSSTQWPPSDDALVSFRSTLTATDNTDITGVWPSAPVGSGTIVLDWEDADTSGAPEGVTDQNSVRITITGIPAEFHYASISVLYDSFFLEASESGDFEGTTVSFLMHYFGDPWIGEAGISYEVSLWLDDDGYDVGSDFTLESAFEGGTAKTVTLDFDDFVAD